MKQIRKLSGLAYLFSALLFILTTKYVSGQVWLIDTALFLSGLAALLYTVASLVIEKDTLHKAVFALQFILLALAYIKIYGNEIVLTQFVDRLFLGLTAIALLYVTLQHWGKQKKLATGVQLLVSLLLIAFSLKFWMRNSDLMAYLQFVPFIILGLVVFALLSKNYIDRTNRSHLIIVGMLLLPTALLTLFKATFF